MKEILKILLAVRLQVSPSKSSLLEKPLIDFFRLARKRPVSVAESWPTQQRERERKSDNGIRGERWELVSKLSRSLEGHFCPLEGREVASANAR